MSKRGRSIRALGVLAILFHFLVILTIPNRESFLNQMIAPVLVPYVNQISMNVAWQFFSPDPGPATYLLVRIQNGSELLAEEYVPPEKDHFTFRTFFNRRIAVMRFVSKDPERVRQILVPWFCQRFPEATVISIDKIVVPVPSLDSVKAGGMLNDLSGQMGASFASAECERGELVE